MAQELTVSSEVRGELAWLRVSGALRAHAAPALARMRPAGVARVVVDLRGVEVADSVGARALREALEGLPGVSCLLPGAWSPAATLLGEELAAFPCCRRPAELSRAFELPARPGRERRRFARHAVRLAAALRLDGAPSRAWTSDLSSGGARLEAANGDWPEDPRDLSGRKVDVEIADLRLRARVVHVSQSSPPSVGLQFLPGRKAVRERLEELLARAA